MRWWSESWRARFGQSLVLGFTAVLVAAAVLAALQLTPTGSWAVALFGGLLSSLGFAAVMASACEPGTSVLWGSRRRRPR